MNTDRYPFEVTCRCGAIYKSEKFVAGDVDKAVHTFNVDHAKCREQNFVKDFFNSSMKRKGN